MTKIKSWYISILNIFMENNITVADLNLLKNIIDLASTRGAFRAGEMKEIGEVYNKLAVFLEAVVAQAQAQEAENNAEDSESKGE
jgi:hypothetical protein